MDKSLLLLLAFALPASAQQSDRKAPACGPDSTTFSAQEQRGTSPIPAPADGKALFVFIQDDARGGKNQHYTVRIGLDGHWSGAYKSDSYFVASVDPGLHHLCADVQTTAVTAQATVLLHLTAEPNHVYYFRTSFPGGLNTQYPIYGYLTFEQPDSDQALFLLGRYPLSVATPSH